jgi:hypothetical protein
VNLFVLNTSRELIKSPMTDGTLPIHVAAATLDICTAKRKFSDST